MQIKRAPTSARQMILQTLIGETGCAALTFILVMMGGGVLLDFQVTNLHPVFSVGLLLASIPLSMLWVIHRVLRMGQQRDPNYIRNLALAAVAGQAGCSTVIMVFAALFAGLFLDSRLNTHPIFTIGLVMLSVPIGLFTMVRLVLSTTARITPPQPPDGGEKPSRPYTIHGDSSTRLTQQSHTKENGP